MSILHDLHPMPEVHSYTCIRLGGDASFQASPPDGTNIIQMLLIYCSITAIAHQLARVNFALNRVPVVSYISS